MTTIKGLPVYAATMDDADCRMLRISLVDDPAVIKTFQAFASEAKRLDYSVEDEDKQLVFGVVMRANFPIYRRDSRLGEYWITYSPEVIRQMTEKYMAEGRTNDFDLMHDGKDVDGIDCVQMFIKDSKKGINPTGFEEIEDGSLFGEFHVNDADIWKAIKDGTYRGFSIETINTIEEVNGIVSTEKIPSEILSWFRIINQITTDMKITNELKLKLARLLGSKFGAVTTDKATLSWEGDDELVAGMEVYILGEDGNRSAVEDGDYTTEDGKVIVVVDSKVSEIKDPSAEVAPENNEGEEEDFHQKVRHAYEESYGEKEKKIADAIAETGLTDFYVVDAGDDFAVVEYFDAENYESKFRRYAVTWDEEGNVIVGASEEGHMGFIPDAAAEDVEEKEDEGNEEFAARLSAVEEMMASVVEVLDRIKTTPAAAPAHEEFKAELKPCGNGNEQLAKLFSK